MHFCVTGGTPTPLKGMNDDLFISSLRREMEGNERRKNKIKQREQIKEENKGREGIEDKEPESRHWARERLSSGVGCHGGRS